MKSFAALALSGLILAPFAQANGEQPCTMMGCESGLMLKLPIDKKWQPGNYAFNFMLDGRKFSCKATLPLKPCEERSVSCDSEAILVIESGCALEKAAHGFGDISIQGAPKKVEVSITHNGSQIGTGSFAPKYTETSPNGENCEPRCVQTQEELILK